MKNNNIEYNDYYFSNYLKRIKIELSEEQLKSFFVVRDLYFYFLFLSKNINPKLAYRCIQHSYRIIYCFEQFLTDYEPESIFDDLMNECYITDIMKNDYNFIDFKTWQRKNKIKKWIQE